MGLKDFLTKKSTEHLEKEREARELAEKKEREAREKAELDAMPVPSHPLQKREMSLLNDYVLGQMILLNEIPTQDTDGRRLLLFAKSLGLNQGHLNEISQVAVLYDE